MLYNLRCFNISFFCSDDQDTNSEHHSFKLAKLYFLLNVFTVVVVFGAENANRVERTFWRVWRRQWRCGGGYVACPIGNGQRRCVIASQCRSVAHCPVMLTLYFHCPIVCTVSSHSKLHWFHWKTLLEKVSCKPHLCCNKCFWIQFSTRTIQHIFHRFLVQQLTVNAHGVNGASETRSGKYTPPVLQSWTLSSTSFLKKKN